MRLRHWHFTVVALLAVGFALIALFALVAPRIRPVAKDESKRIAVAALVQSQSAPTPGCNPGLGAGHLGVCAPAQAMAFANALGKAAGDPDDVRSLGPLGIDISNNNGCGFRLAGLGIRFAYFKESEGPYFHDRCAAGFIAQAKALHIAYGVYHFLRARPSYSPRSEAAWFVHNLARDGALRAPLPPVVDVEVNDRGMGPGALHAYVCGFLKAVRGYLHSNRASVYTGNWFWGPQVGGDNCSGALLWVSAYAPRPIVPLAWQAAGHSIWQYSDGRFGPTPHIAGVDSDVMVRPGRYFGQPQPKPSPPPKPLTGRARAHAQLARRHTLAQLRIRHCARHRARADCQRLYRHNATLKKELGIR